MANDDEKPKVDRLIDANLKRVYDTVLHEEIPDRFAQLLDRLQNGDDTASPPSASNRSRGDA